jgi:hypothetical protein
MAMTRANGPLVSRTSSVPRIAALLAGVLLAILVLVTEIFTFEPSRR